MRESTPTAAPSQSEQSDSGTGPANSTLDDRWNMLMAAAQGGNDRAYEQLMREVRKWLWRYLSKRLPPSVAEDATQETLLAIHMHKQKYKANAPMTPWLKTIARFKWIDQLRGSVRNPDSLDENDVSVADHGPAARAAILLEQLLTDVKPAQAHVIKLVKLHGASVDEAASATGQSPSLVKVNIHRGLKRMRQSLSE